MSEMLIAFNYGVSMVPIVAHDAAEPANACLAGAKRGIVKLRHFVNRGEQAEELLFRNCSSL